MESTTRTRTSQSDPCLTLTLKPRDVALAEEAKSLREQLHSLNMRKEAIDQEFRQRLDQAGAKIGVYKSRVLVQLSPWSRKTIDVKAFRDADPEYAETFERETSGESLKFP